MYLKKNQNAPRPTEHPPAIRGGKMSKRLGGIIGCKYKTSSWPLYGTGSNIRSILFVCETHFFFFISLIADGPHHYHPACGHKGSFHLSPVHALQFFIFVRCEQTHHKRTAEKCSRAKVKQHIMPSSWFGDRLTYFSNLPYRPKDTIGYLLQEQSLLTSQHNG